MKRIIDGLNGLAIRPLPCLAVAVLLLTGSAVVAAERVYRWIDADGTVHFSDQAVPGAERLEVEPAPTVDLEPVPRSTSRSAERPRATPAPVDYRLSIANLSDEEVVWNDARELPVELSVRPPLATERGHRLVVYLDGIARETLTEDTRVRLQDVDRGSHRVWAEIVDGDGRRLAASKRLTIYHRQHSRLGPGQ